MPGGSLPAQRLVLAKQCEAIVHGPGTVEERDAKLGALIDEQPNEALKNIVREALAALHEHASVDQAQAPEGFTPDFFDRVRGE